MSKYDNPELMAKWNDDEFQWAYDLMFDNQGLRQCGCGYFEGRLELIRQALGDMPLYNLERDNRDKYRTDLGEMFLCLLGGAELIEHGSSIGGSWLTEKGERLLKVLKDPDYWTLLTED